MSDERLTVERARELVADLGLMIEGYRKVAELSKRQTEAMGSADGDELWRVVSEKKKLVDEIAETEVRVKAVSALWPEHRSDLPEADAAAVETALDEVHQVLASLIETEKEANAGLEAKRDATSAQSQEVSRGRRAIQAYGGPRRSGPGGQSPRFVDRKE